MGMEILGADAVAVANGDGVLEVVSGVSEIEEHIVFGSNGDGVNGASKEVELVAPNDGAEEWPAERQVHSFWFVKVRSYDDPKLKAKIEQADKEIQKKNQARFDIMEALRAKRTERSNIIAQLKPLSSENREFSKVIDGKRKDMEPLQDALGKIRDESNAARERGAGLCSSEEELNDIINSLQYRINHESISLDEEKRLVREIKQLEGTRSKVVANAARRAETRDSAATKETIQGQVKLIVADIDEVRKEREAVRAKIRVFEDQLKGVDAEINALQEELAAATAKKDKAYETINQLRKSRDEINAGFYQSRALLNRARDLAAKNDVTTLQGLHQIEIEKFSSKWRDSKEFREDYERRILSSLNGRMLCRDGRMRNPDEKPIPLEAQPIAEPEPSQAPASAPAPAPAGKSSTKQVKETVAPTLPAAAEELRQKESAKNAEEPKAKPRRSSDTGKTPPVDDAEEPKEIVKPKEIDPETLKEMERQEQIAKNQQALERKKKLAEKKASRAAAIAQREAEKKQKEKEKRAKKRGGGPSGSADPEAQSETDAKAEDDEEAEPTEEVTAPQAAVKSKEPKEITVRSIGGSRSRHDIRKVIQKKKKAQWWSAWAILAAAAGVAILAIVLAILGYNRFYLQASS